MNVAGAAKKGFRYWWFALICLCLLSCAVPIVCNGDPARIAKNIPAGCRISNLGQHLAKFYDESEVIEWSRAKPGDGSAEVKATRYGSFHEVSLGPYEKWVASESHSDAFTGELRFWHNSWVIPDDLAPSYEVSLVFVDGVLKEKDYGYLPG